jgi:hypothetical protein
MLYIQNIILTQVRGTKVPPKTQGTYGSPETPPLKENNLMLT